MVAFDLHLGRQAEKLRDGGEEHRRGLPALARAHEASDRLGEEQRGRGRRRIHSDGEPGHVHAFGNHAHGNHPSLVSSGELGDPVGGAGVVGKHHGWPLPADGLQPFRVCAGGLLVGGDDEAPGVGNRFAHGGQAFVGRGEDRLDPVARGVEGGPPGLPGHVFGQRLAEGRFDDVALLRLPPHLPRVAEEHDGPHDAVAQRLGVPVRVIGARAEHAVAVVGVLDERDRRIVRPEGRACEREPPGRSLEGLAYAVAPREGVAAVVDFVKDDEGRPGSGAALVKPWIRRDLRVRDAHSVEEAAFFALRVREVGVEGEAHARGRLRPLRFQMLGGAHDGDPSDSALCHELCRDAQGEGRLPRSGRRHCEEILRLACHVRLERLGLPCPQGRRRAPGRALREGGREGLCGVDGSGFREWVAAQAAHFPFPGTSGPKGHEEPCLPSSSRMALHVGHTGYLSGSREGVHTFPHSATTGWPDRADSVIFSLRT